MAEASYDSFFQLMDQYKQQQLGRAQFTPNSGVKKTGPGGGPNNMAVGQRKFKKGDRAICTFKNQSYEGKEVTIVGYDNPYYLVDFDDIGDGYQFEARHLEPVEPAKARKKVGFDSVIMPDHKRQQILEALEQIHQQELIFTTWGFGETIEKGRGVSLLFHGPPGTGKTLCAQAIADHLGHKLVVISTADIESPMPGEAERNIRKHFADARKSGKHILLFDECDSIIYSRKNVGPIMSAVINELLSQLERYDGLTIFTTNRLGTLDEAVNRRLALKLEFAMPSQEERAEIWKRMFPAKAPLSADIDWMKLAIVEVTGGYIKNAVLRAARMAAIEKKPDMDKAIDMEKLTKALTQEAEAMMEFSKAQKKHEGSIGHVGQRVEFLTRGNHHD